MPKKEEQTELEKCKAILGARYLNILILVETENGWISETNSHCAGYGLASRYLKKLDEAEDYNLD